MLLPPPLGRTKVGSERLVDRKGDAGLKGVELSSEKVFAMRLIDRLKAKIADQEAFYSFEFFPPASERGRRNLQLRIDRMAEMTPLFVDIASEDAALSLGVAKETLRFCGVDVMMHVTMPFPGGGGPGLTRAGLRAILADSKAAGVRNVLVDYAAAAAAATAAAAGAAAPEDDVAGDGDGDCLRRPQDVVELIRAQFQDYFTVVVPAFPEGLRPGLLPSGASREASREECLQQLKACVEAGADFCVTEPFFDTRVFFQLVANLRAAGVTRSFPVVPGLALIQGLSSFRSVVRHLGLSVPAAVTERLATLEREMQGTEAENAAKAADKGKVEGEDGLVSPSAAVQEYGLQLGESMVRELLDSGSVYGVHFYTLNLEFSVRTLLEDRVKITPKSALPWRPSAEPKREQEDVRPIFWANRPKSYLLRTESWDQFPSGRWGSAQEDVAFAELRKNDSGLFMRETFFQRPEVQKKAWGEAPTTREEIFEVFVGFVQGRVPFLPWCEESLHLETSLIQRQLVAINRAGFLTINSQPRVNAAPSNHPQFGWGPDGGYVYQKAYIEFFTSPRMLGRLIQLLQTPELADRSQYVYHAVDCRGNSYTNSSDKRPCAVTWGVFPGKEVIQPTVVDPTAFLAWKDEAFALWVDGWASIYDEHGDSADLLHDLHDEYFLVNIVDNDFVNGNIFDIFDRLMSS